MRPAMWKIAALLCLLAFPARADATGVLVANKNCAGNAMALVAQGCARVYPLPGINADFPALLAVEDTARRAHIGIWNNPAFAVRSPAHAAELTDGYGIIEGKITSAAKAKGQIYLNFGPDWKTDFTVELANEAAKQLQARAIDWQQLAGRTVRVRGWVFWRYGPAIMVTADAQIELPDDKPGNQ